MFEVLFYGEKMIEIVENSSGLWYPYKVNTVYLMQE